jgi:hypothetical protein
MKKITTSIAYSLIAVLLFSCGSDKKETESNVEIETQIVEATEATKKLGRVYCQSIREYNA